jgi:hypothetical protein
MNLTIKDLAKEIDMTAVRGGANANTSAPSQSNVSTPVFNVVSGAGSVAIDGNTHQSNYASMPSFQIQDSLLVGLEQRLRGISLL